MPAGQIREAGELELAGILMLKNVNKLHNFEACLHFIASKCPLNKVGMDYKSKQVAHIIRMRVASQKVALSSKFQN